MKRTPFLAIVLLTCAFPAHAQDAMKKNAAVKPADPESKVVLDSWNEIGRKLTAMAEDFPEDKYDFKPTPAQRSFAEQLLHAAASCYYFTNPVTGQKPPAAEDPKRDQYNSKADIVAFVKKAFADGAAAIQAKGEKGLTTEVVYFPQPEIARYQRCYGIMSIAVNTTASRCVLPPRVLCRRSRGPVSEAIVPISAHTVIYPSGRQMEVMRFTMSVNDKSLVPYRQCSAARPSRAPTLFVRSSADTAICSNALAR